MNGTEAEIERFIDQLLQNAGEDASLPFFCKYLTMTVCYAAAEYLDSIGCLREGFRPLEIRPDDSTQKPEEAWNTAHQGLETGNRTAGQRE